MFGGAFVDEDVERCGFAELRVGDDDFARVDVGGVDAALDEGGGDDAAGEAFAVADDEVGDARGEFEDGGEAAEDFVEGVEFLLDEIAEGGGVGGVLMRAQAVSRWRERRRELMARAPVRSPWQRRTAARRSWSVTLAMALTTTTVCLPAATRPATMAAVRLMAVGSSTEVPPNFITTRLMRSLFRPQGLKPLILSRVFRHD